MSHPPEVPPESFEPPAIQPAEQIPLPQRRPTWLPEESTQRALTERSGMFEPAIHSTGDPFRSLRIMQAAAQLAKAGAELASLRAVSVISFPGIKDEDTVRLPLTGPEQQADDTVPSEVAAAAAHHALEQEAVEAARGAQHLLEGTDDLPAFQQARKAAPVDPAAPVREVFGLKPPAVEPAADAPLVPSAGESPSPEELAAAAERLFQDLITNPELATLILDRLVLGHFWAGENAADIRARLQRYVVRVQGLAEQAISGRGEAGGRVGPSYGHSTEEHERDTALERILRGLNRL